MKYLSLPLVIGLNAAPMAAELENYLEHAKDHVDGMDKVVTGKVFPGDISTFHKGYYWGTFIYLRGGQVLLTNLEVESFEVILENYYKQS